VTLDIIKSLPLRVAGRYYRAEPAHNVGEEFEIDRVWLGDIDVTSAIPDSEWKDIETLCLEARDE
jgi:hypothetical protein